MKAKLEIVPRPTDMGRNAPGEVQAALRRERYMGALESELGIDPAARRVRLPRPAGSINWGTVVSTFGMALIAFATIFAFLLWREGRLPRLWPESPPEWIPKPPSTDWILSGKAPASKVAVPREAITPADEPAPDVSVTVLPRAGEPVDQSEEADDAG